MKTAIRYSLIAISTLFLVACIATMVSISAPAFAQVASAPTYQCPPRPIGDEHSTHQTRVPSTAGEAFYWHCERRFTWVPQATVRLNDYRMVHPSTDGLSMLQTFDAYWKANVTLLPSDARIKPLYDAALAEARKHTPAPPQWLVLTNSTRPDRPMRLLVPPATTGAEPTLGIESPLYRAPVGRMCDCTKFAKRVETVSRFQTWCPVYGSPPEVVALCARTIKWEPEQ